jgi:hypothetical protein
MSSPTVRDSIKAAITVLADPWPVFDMSDYNTIDEVLNSIMAEAVLIEYIAADDQIQTIGGQGNQGYEETGTAIIHMIVPTGFASSPAVNKGYNIQIGMRGRRLTPEITIQSMSPFVDFGSGSIGVNGAVHGFASSLFYVNRNCG